jgi:threonine aldolase
VSFSLASDNHAGAHPAVLAAITAANGGHVAGYGADPLTQSVLATIGSAFGPSAAAYLVFTGTGANVLGLQAHIHSYQAIICTAHAHLHVDECGAPEKNLGAKLLLAADTAGKLNPTTVQAILSSLRGDEHQVQPLVLSITNATELGTVYQPAEIRELADFAHANGLLLHVDGARIANAAAQCGCSLAELTTTQGVDILSLGGTKNGLLAAECIIFRDKSLAAAFPFIRKQGMQLASKMRFLAAQFQAFWADDNWRQWAKHANDMAQYLASQVSGIAGIDIAFPVESNAVFVHLPRHWVEPLQAVTPFYVWEEVPGQDRVLVRWMCAFDTQQADIDAFVNAVGNVAGVSEMKAQVGA